MDEAGFKVLNLNVVAKWDPFTLRNREMNLVDIEVEQRIECIINFLANQEHESENAANEAKIAELTHTIEQSTEQQNRLRSELSSVQVCRLCGRRGRFHAVKITILSI